MTVECIANSLASFGYGLLVAAIIFISAKDIVNRKEKWEKQE